MKIRLSDIAKRAGVGHATVDRVMNQRGGVRPQTVKCILAAAKELGYDRKLPTPYQQGLRFEVLLGRRDLPLCARINDAITHNSRTYDDTVVVQRTFLDETRPETFAKAILSSRSNALIVYGQENELIVEAIAEATAAGKPVVAIVSDVPTAPRFSYVGIDHYRAGRTAAFFLSSMAAHGRILLVSNSLQYRAQAERISGCQDGISEYTDGTAEVILIELKEDGSSSNRLLAEALAADDVTGIYNAGIEHSTLNQFLERRGTSFDPVLVGHDLSSDAENMLQSGTMTLVIDQNPDQQVRKALAILALRFGVEGVPEENTMVPFTIHVKDSV